jgi:hypothetical protein
MFCYTRARVKLYFVPTPRRNAIVQQIDVEGDMGQRLDEQKLDQLRTWGAGLAASSNQELRATGKAILLLIEEIEALHVEIWNERARATSERMPADEPRDGNEGELGESLRTRLTRFTHRQPRTPG